MISNYRFLKTKGHTYFANIAIECQIIKSGIYVSSDYESIMKDWVEEEYDSPKLWIEIAKKSVEATAKYIIHQSEDVSGMDIKLKKVIGTTLDTDEHTVFCAASLALIKMFPDIEKYTSLFFDRHWKVKVKETVFTLK